MKRELRVTEDGSHTLYVAEMDESYHSVHGAIQESEHVFIKHGFNTLSGSAVRILEIGFGTGLNALLTMAQAESLGVRVHYHAVEKYPVLKEEYERINYEKLIGSAPTGSFLYLHEAPWNVAIRISETFTLFKDQSDFRTMNPVGPFDLVYYDAFDPGKQPYLWTEEIFRRISERMSPGAILVSYTSKGSVRRALQSCGFQVVKVPGPPGKREMIRATKS